MGTIGCEEFNFTKKTKMIPPGPFFLFFREFSRPRRACRPCGTAAGASLPLARHGARHG
jgi:hypothetical protein